MIYPPSKWTGSNTFVQSPNYTPPHEIPDADYPLWLTTGRLVYHFHTRTKTGRSPAFNGAAPDAYVQILTRIKQAAPQTLVVAA